MEEIQQQTKRSRRTAVEIKQLLGDFKQSGLTALEFSQSIGITEGAFQKLRSRHGEKTACEQKGFIHLQSRSITGSESGLFAEVDGIRIYQPVSAQYLKELLA